MNYSQQDVAAPMMPVYAKLLKASPPLRIVIMSGDDDSVCATLGTQHHLGPHRSIASPWQPWWMRDGQVPWPACKQVAGYHVKFDGISLVTVRGGAPGARDSPAQGLRKQPLSGDGGET